MRIFRIGTRGSPLALAQTQEVIKALCVHHPFLKERLEVVPLKTTGDTIVDRRLTDIGGKSLFTKEIELALVKKQVDIAVHSMKDMTTEPLSELTVSAMLEREDPRDALISHNRKKLEDFSFGSLFGTSSLRRQAQILHKFPQFQVVSLRGNVSTRLEKVKNGEVHATLLAVAGLKRLSILTKATEILSLDYFIPAVGQGAIGIQSRVEDTELLDLLSPLNHFPTFQAVTAERAFLKALNGSCRTPIAAHALFKEETLYLKGMKSAPNGQDMRFISHQGPACQAEKIGLEAAQTLLEKA